MSELLKRLSKATAILPQPQITYLFSVKAIRDYSPNVEEELEMKENEMMLVVEEKQDFYYAYSPTLSQYGYIPKNFTSKELPFVSIPAFALLDYGGDFDEFLYVEKNEKLIVVARDKESNDFVYCKRNKIGQQFGKLPIDVLFMDGSIDKLPIFEEYKNRHFPKDRNRSASSASVQPYKTSIEEDKIMKKLIMQTSSSSLRESKSKNYRVSRSLSMSFSSLSRSRKSIIKPDE